MKSSLKTYFAASGMRVGNIELTSSSFLYMSLVANNGVVGAEGRRKNTYFFLPRVTAETDRILYENYLVFTLYPLIISSSVHTLTAKHLYTITSYSYL